jgi:hypothetical protein
MKAVGSIYRGERFQAVALYNEYSDIYSALPKPMHGRHVMHVQYSYSNKTRSFDVYTIEELNAANLIVKKNLNSRNHSGLDINKIFHAHNVLIETVSDIHYTRLEEELRNITALDISLFCRNDVKGIMGSTTRYFNKIIPFTKIAYSHPKYLLRPENRNLCRHAC